MRYPQSKHPHHLRALSPVRTFRLVRKSLMLEPVDRGKKNPPDIGGILLHSVTLQEPVDRARRDSDKCSALPIHRLNPFGRDPLTDRLPTNFKAFAGFSDRVVVFQLSGERCAAPSRCIFHTRKIPRRVNGLVSPQQALGWRKVQLPEACELAPNSSSPLPSDFDALEISAPRTDLCCWR